MLITVRGKRLTNFQTTMAYQEVTCFPPQAFHCHFPQGGSRYFTESIGGHHNIISYLFDKQQYQIKTQFHQSKLLLTNADYWLLFISNSLVLALQGEGKGFNHFTPMISLVNLLTSCCTILMI